MRERPALIAWLASPSSTHEKESKNSCQAPSLSWRRAIYLGMSSVAR